MEKIHLNNKKLKNGWGYVINSSESVAAIVYDEEVFENLLIKYPS